MKNAVIISIFLGFTLSACVGDWVSEPPTGPPDVTRILEIKVNPNPVVEGDTTRFTIIIEDSLDNRFRFRWFLDDRAGRVVGKPEDGDSQVTTHDNSILWIPYSVPHDTSYEFQGNAGIPESDSAEVGTFFHVTVLARQNE